MLADPRDRAIQGPEKARVNRTIILDTARHWHGPDIIAGPSDPQPLNATPAARVG
jgi:hypothetical protein